MRICKSKGLGFVAGMVFMLAGSSGAFADDSEIYLSQPTSANAPNIMFIFDTSGSMGSIVSTTAPFDATQSYPGTGICAGLGGRVFYVSGNSQGTPPACDSVSWFSSASLKCAAALTPMSSAGSGVFQDSMIRWGGNNANKQWSRTLNIANGSDVECLADSGSDGNLSTSTPYPSKNAAVSANGVWTASAAQSYWVSGQKVVYTLYSGKYVSWYNQYRVTVLGTRMSIMQQAATNLLNNLSGVNVGLMRYSDNGGSVPENFARGGMVAAPISPIETSRASLVSTINAYTPNGYTPLSETLYESYLYFSGKPVFFGNSSVPFLSVPASRSPSDNNSYKSPMDSSCSNNVVYLTDGLPTADSEANPLITGLPNFATLGGSCLVAGSGPDPGWPNSGLCLGALAQYMNKADLRPAPSDPAGQQNVTTYFIGLGSDFVDTSTNQLNAAFDYIHTAAIRGGGQAYQASDLSDLDQVLTTIAGKIKQSAATFTAPTVAVNAFNQTKSLNDLYVSMFTPTTTWHWPGNVKKYKLINGVIQDAGNLPAVDPGTGFINKTSQSYWASIPDGADVATGGAASHIPIPASRNVYTYPNPAASNVTPGSNTPVALAGSANTAVGSSNVLLTDALLGTGAGNPTRAKLIEWARGADVDATISTDITAPRHEMGDPLHSQPAVVIYGGTPATPNIDDAVLYTATNDGYLHALNVTDGVERWAFIPPDLLGNLINVYNDDVTTGKQYALDGDVTILKFDTNGDGVITASAGDRVLLFVGQGRGGSHYYALDVTDKDNPKFMWNIGPAQLPNIGQAWAAPVIARVKIGAGGASSGQNNQNFVLVISGGYDSAEDGSSTVGTYQASDAVGNRLFVVDALYGTLLWSGGPTGSATTQQFGTRMDHSIPAAPSVIDTNNDGLDDRIYVGDTAGQLWRFDISNGNPASSLMAGGVLASLGAHDDGSPVTANARRFYSTPDPAQVTLPNVTPFMNIAIASGYRGHPLNTTIQDRLYSFRDYAPFTAMTQAQYTAYAVKHDADLVDITGVANPVVPSGSVGWKMLLNQHGGWVGEKSLSAAQTVSGAIYYTSWMPGAPASSAPCSPPTGTARAYVINVLNGAAAIDLNKSGNVDQSDISMIIPATGILPPLTTLYRVGGGSGGPPPPPGCGTPGNPACPPPAPNVCLLGTVTVPCPPFNDKIRTYWREGAAN
jgi:type IV pilus assembly protein PilY1